MSAPEPSAAAPRVRAGAPAGLLGAGLAVCLVYFGALALARPVTVGFPLDDSWIHLALARSLSDGGGLALNPGEPVAASTAPLWTALVALFGLLPGSTPGWMLAAGVALYLATVDAAVRLARELDLGRGLALLAGVLTMATSWMVWSALSGLEIPLFTTLSLWGMVLHLRERRAPGAPPRSIAVLAAACLARPEALLLVLLALADRLLLWRRRDDGGLAIDRARLGAAARQAAPALALAALMVAPVALWNWTVGGSALPTTFAAKAGGERTWLPDLGYLWAVLQILWRSQPFSVLTAGAGALVLVERLGGARDRGLLPVLWLAGLPLAYSALNPVGGAVVAGNFGRYYFPLFPVLAVVAAVGLEGVARRLAPAPGAPRCAAAARVGALVGALVLLAPTVWGLVGGVGRYVQTVSNVEDGDVAAARWLAPRLAPGAVVAVNDIGALKFFLPDHRIVDLAGIAHPELRHELAAAAAAGRPRAEAFERFLAERRADVLVVFPNWFPELVRDSRFRRVRTFEVPNNVTLGGDEIWVLETPWSRAPLAAPADEEMSDGA